jgi:hypothetical protein
MIKRFFAPFFKPVVNFMLKPSQDKLRTSEPEFQKAIGLYNSGRKQEALSEFEKLVSANQSDKAARSWIGRISGELENKEQQKGGNKPK